MPRKSAIAKLPPELRAEIDRLIRDGRYTIDQIVAHMRGMGATEIKRTAVGDYKQKMDKSLERYREAQEVAGTWVAQLGENPQGDVGRLCAEMLKTVAFKTLADMGNAEVGVQPGDIMVLARAIKDLESAQKTNLEFRAKLRAEWKQELEEKAKSAESQIKEAQRTAGLSDSAAATMREILLGVVS